MDNQVHNSIVSFIWGIADDCLRDVYVRGKYRDVILPMTVIRRLDALLEDSKDAVLEMKKRLDAAKIDNQWPALCNAAGQAFCNASPYRLRDLTSRAKKQTLKADFIAYLDGFSPNVQVILDKFKFRNQIDTMVDADILGAVIEKFVSSDINLSPNPVWKDEAKTIMRHPGLDNHGMGTIFEELIRRFNEENNEEAGEHWTPRDVVELNIVLFSISNYFLRFSNEYKTVHQLKEFDNNWYEFVEYGTTNPITILLQRNGFSREVSTYIRNNKDEFIIEGPDGKWHLSTALLECSNTNARTEASSVRYNMPELFIAESGNV